MLGIDLPHTILESAQEGKAAIGTIYKNYGIGLIMDNRLNPYAALRPCGFFDEPGVIGTFCGLMSAPYILCFNKKTLSSKKFIYTLNIKTVAYL